MEFNEKLQKLRTGMGLTQEELADWFPAFIGLAMFWVQF